MDQYFVRRLEPMDIDHLLPLLKEHAVYENACYVERDQRHDLEKYIFSDPCRLYCWVVEDGAGRLVGYCTYMFEFSTWKAAHYLHMDCLYLQPQVRGRGIGTQLMERLICHSRELGVTEIQWQTPEDNYGAIEFYRKLGAGSKKKLRFILDTSEI